MKPLNYSISQRVLHWGMALLIFFNLIFSDGMEKWDRAVDKGEPITPDILSGANIHAYVGFTIVALAIIRLVLRFTQGVPSLPSDEPPALKLLAKVTHGLLYLLFFAMPFAGIGKYYFGNDTAGMVHGGPMKLLLWVLIVLHVLGALVQKFYFKTDVLDRITKGVKA